MTYPIGTSFKFKKDIEPEYTPRLRDVGEHVVFTRALKSAAEQITVNVIPFGELAV
jgi:hypothetical protein